MLRNEVPSNKFQTFLPQKQVTKIDEINPATNFVFWLTRWNQKFYVQWHSHLNNTENFLFQNLVLLEIYGLPLRLVSGILSCFVNC